jgi:DNA-binding NtrC family response regulator
MSSTVLLVEDEDVMRQTLEDVFRDARYEVLSCTTGAAAEEAFRREMVDVVLLDLRLPDRSGLDLFRTLRAINAEVPVLMMTAFPDMRDAVQAIKEGAHDYIPKPFELPALKLSVANACEWAQLRSEVTRLRSQTGAESAVLVGASPGIRELTALVTRVATARDTPVLITGESGAGKEVVAGLIHRLSARSAGPLVCLNSSAIPESLLEAELFGYERGAFTGAVAGKKGLLEMAERGTFLLDEVGDLPLFLQPKLLRVLEGGRLRRIGGLRDIPLDVRVLCATNQDLRAAIRNGRFREDLYFRLNVVEVRVPPLRERREDIRPLAAHFLERLGRSVRRKGATLDPGALEALERHAWPGNVRELRNVIERALILADDVRIGLIDLPPELRAAAPGRADAGDDAGDVTLRTVRRKHILAVLDRCGGNRTEAARLLGISRSTLKDLLRGGSGPPP